MPSFFTEEYHRFFIDLAPHNHKEWFDENRPRYENYVKKPFLEFTKVFIESLGNSYPELRGLDPKSCIFRINRDIRFSKDKTPYKMHMSAAISPQGRKHINNSGFYFEFNPECLRIYQGAYLVEPGSLLSLRQYMARNLSKLDTLVNEKAFRKLYGEVLGDVQARVPKEFKEAHAKQPLMANKNFYWYAELPPEMLTDSKLLKQMMNYYEAGKPLSDFFDKGMAY